MITEKELLDAIRECESEPITLNKVGKLADFYILYDHLFGEPDIGYSYASNAETTIETSGNSVFLRTVNGKNADAVWTVIDELMDTIKVLHPRLYDSVLRKIE